MHMTDNTPPDLAAASRTDLLQSHVIHDFRRQRVVENLRGCYGQLMSTVYRDMLRLVVGNRVIDCGCGFGQFSRVALDAGFDVTSFDIDDASLDIAYTVSGIRPIRESVYATSLADGSRDTAVCCDSIQHFDIGHFAREVERLGVDRVIVYDSNIKNPLLGGYRLLTGHKETNDRTAEAIVAEFEAQGFDCVMRRYENIVSLPVSGGFQRRPLPIVHRRPKAIAAIDAWMAQASRRCGLDRWLAFRFLLVLDRRGSPLHRGV